MSCRQYSKHILQVFFFCGTVVIIPAQGDYTSHFLVRLKHTELVPDKMTEEAFWTQFFQSQFFHRDSPSGRNLFSECLTQEQKSERMNEIFTLISG